MSIHHRKLALASRSARYFGFPLGAALLAVSACSSSGGSTTSAGSGGTGGAANGHAGANTGGATNSGGTSAGGAVSSAGAATGGASAAGGAANAGAGGAVSNAGGNSNSAGSSNAGSAGSTGGSHAGGASNTAGASAGGAGNTAGTSSSAGASNTAGAGGASTSSYDPCPTDGSPCKIMPFGDSITDGYGVPGGYRIQLFTSAHQAGKNLTFVGSGQNGPTMADGVAFPQHHEGHSGFTIDPTPSRSGISPLVATVMPEFTPHIVTLMIGTNDAIDDYQMATAPTRLGTLIDSIISALPNALIVVAQLIPSQDDALNTRIQTYNAAIPAVVQTRVSSGKHLLLVNMYPVIASNPNYKTALLNDTWHPNSDGYALMAGVWYGVLGPLLH